MYVAVVPNRKSPPAILLRESFRNNGKVHNRTLANISHWPPEQIGALRQVLKGATAVASSADSFQILRPLPHARVAAVVGSLRQLGLDSVMDAASHRSRDLVIAMIAARILDPCSKLATARALHPDTLRSSLSAYLGLETTGEDQLYRAMDWLLQRQPAMEAALAKRHLAEGGLVLYDLTSTYFEGRHCQLARLGHSRDDKSGKPQIVFGLLTNAAGCPVAVEVWEGNTADPKTVPAQVKKLRQDFGLKRLVLVGDRGMITSARFAKTSVPRAASVGSRPCALAQFRSWRPQALCSYRCSTRPIWPKSLIPIIRVNGWECASIRSCPRSVRANGRICCRPPKKNWKRSPLPPGVRSGPYAASTPLVYVWAVCWGASRWASTTRCAVKRMAFAMSARPTVLNARRSWTAST